ncbi:hypothetical protein HQ584_04175 [Patescibacteria group bacterium]|nr:hypothetical protein [Patescibacteria group bacterium]
MLTALKQCQDFSRAMDRATVYDFTQVMFKEVTLKGSRVYIRTDYSRAIDLLIPEQDNLRPLISHRFGLGKSSWGPGFS